MQMGDGGRRGRAGRGRDSLRLAGLADAFDRLFQGTVGQRIGHEIIGTQAKQLMQAGGADLVGDEDHLDMALGGGADHLGDAGQIALVFAIDGDGHEFEAGGIGLGEEFAGILEGEVAPGFAEFEFHVVDQQIEILDIPRDGAGQNRRRIGHHVGSSAHRLFVLLVGKWRWRPWPVPDKERAARHRSSPHGTLAVRLFPVTAKAGGQWWRFLG